MALVEKNCNVVVHNHRNENLLKELAIIPNGRTVEFEQRLLEILCHLASVFCFAQASRPSKEERRNDAAVSRAFDVETKGFFDVVLSNECVKHNVVVVGVGWGGEEYGLVSG